MPSPSDYYAPWVRLELQEKVLAHYERRLAEDADTIADLRDPLRRPELHLAPEAPATRREVAELRRRVERLEALTRCAPKDS